MKTSMTSFPRSEGRTPSVRGYLSHSVLGLLMREGKVVRENETHKHKAVGS